MKRKINSAKKPISVVKNNKKATKTGNLKEKKTAKIKTEKLIKPTIVSKSDTNVSLFY